MRKTVATVLALSLLAHGAASALASVHPAQMGDQGGQKAAELEQALLQNNPYMTGSSSASSSQAASQATAAYPSYTMTEGSTGGQGAFPGSTGETVTDDGDVIINEETGEIILGGSTGSTGTSSGTQALNWFNGGYDLINQYKNITVYDINSGITWGAKYINGKNHADVIPASQSDATKLTNNKITGSYVRRPVIVTINGIQFAGSMYAVGHGSTSYCSYFKGVMCIHFTGSMTHGSQKVDSDHQSAIQSALSYGN